MNVFLLCHSVQPVARLAHTGMPSANAAASTIVAGLLLESVSIPLGIFFVPLYGAAEVVTGLYSIGQVLAGVGLGLLLHVYQTRTPAYLRLVEFLICLIGGVTALIVMKKQDPDSDFSYAIDVFAALWWQLAAFVLVLVWFEFRLVKEIARKSIAGVHQVDFLYYQPLDEPVNYNLTEPGKKKKSAFYFPFFSRHFSRCCFLIHII